MATKAEKKAKKEKLKRMYHDVRVILPPNKVFADKRKKNRNQEKARFKKEDY